MRVRRRPIDSDSEQGFNGWNQHCVYVAATKFAEAVKPARGGAKGEGEDKKKTSFIIYTLMFMAL